MSRMTIIGVMGRGEGALGRDVAVAFELGRRIAQEGWTLLTGGRNVGVMDSVNNGAKAAGGLTIGILPGQDTGELSTFVDVPILTGIGMARNYINILSSHVVIACGEGGAGTASEIALAIKAKKPLVLLNAGQEAETYFKKLGGEHVSIVTTPDDAIARVKQFLNAP